MSYQIIDTGASISIVSEDADKAIMKHLISEVGLTRENRIRISMNTPLKTIYLVHADVTVPVFPTPAGLRDQIIQWVTECVCCDGGIR